MECHNKSCRHGYFNASYPHNCRKWILALSESCGFYDKPLKKGKEMKKELKTPVIHYQDMIKYVEGFSIVEGQEKPDYKTMKDSMGEAWISSDCQLCQTYKSESVACKGDCPLSKKGQNCHRRSSHFSQMVSSPTWVIWLDHAYKLLEVLREIEKESAKKEITYKVGQRFLHTNGEKFTLIQTNYNPIRIAIIRIGANHTYNESREVENTNNITQKEFNTLSDSPHYFTLIEDK